MADEFYRGGSSLKPKAYDVVVNRATGLISTKRGGFQYLAGRTMKPL
jgi:hypothetical protein